MLVSNVIEKIASMLADSVGKVWVTGQSGVGKTTLVYACNKAGIKAFDLDRAGERDKDGKWVVRVSKIPSDCKVIAGTCDHFILVSGASCPNDIRATQPLGVDLVIWLAAVPPFWQLSNFAKAVQQIGKHGEPIDGVPVEVAQNSDTRRRLFRALFSDDEVISMDRLELTDFREPRGPNGSASTMDRFLRRDVAPVVSTPVETIRLTHLRMPIVGWAYSRVMTDTFKVGYSAGELYCICTASKRNAEQLAASVQILEQNNFNVRSIHVAGLQGSKSGVRKFFAELEKPILQKIAWGAPVSRHVPEVVGVFGLPQVPGKWSGV